MGSKHAPELITQDELVSARQELLAMVDTVESAISAMKKLKVDSMWMFYRASLDGNNGGMSRLSTFIGGLDHARRRLISGKPIYDGESKTRGVANQQAEKEARKVAEDEKVYDVFKEVMAEIGPELEKRVSERMRNGHSQPSTTKPQNGKRKTR
jgi:hypothetical protein